MECASGPGGIVRTTVQEVAVDFLEDLAYHGKHHKSTITSLCHEITENYLAKQVQFYCDSSSHRRAVSMRFFQALRALAMPEIDLLLTRTTIASQILAIPRQTQPPSAAKFQYWVNYYYYKILITIN